MKHMDAATLKRWMREIKRRNPVAHASGKVNRAVTHTNRAKALKMGAKPKHRGTYEER